MFEFIGHTAMPLLYKHLEAEMTEVNRRGVNVQSLKGLRQVLSTFEGKSLTAKSLQVDKFLELTFFFQLDWVLIQDITYFAPQLRWVYKDVHRADEMRGVVTGTLESWLYLATIDKQFQLPPLLGEFVQRLQSFLVSTL